MNPARVGCGGEQHAPDLWEGGDQPPGHRHSELPLRYTLFTDHPLEHLQRRLPRLVQGMVIRPPQAFRRAGFPWPLVQPRQTHEHLSGGVDVTPGPGTDRPHPFQKQQRSRAQMGDVQQTRRDRFCPVGFQGTVHSLFSAQLAVDALHHELRGPQTASWTPELSLHPKHLSGLQAASQGAEAYGMERPTIVTLREGHEMLPLQGQ
jgi:hypothetical protein